MGRIACGKAAGGSALPSKVMRGDALPVSGDVVSCDESFTCAFKFSAWLFFSPLLLSLRICIVAQVCGKDSCGEGAQACGKDSCGYFLVAALR